MPYVLGIDLGSTRTRAAVSRAVGSSWAPPDVVKLDGRSWAVPSVLHVSADGSLTVGDLAWDGAPVEGGRIARDFLRRIGDEVPLVLAGEACMAQTLAAVLTMWVVERVVAQEGGPADHIVISHPAGWGPYRTRLLSAALWDIGLPYVTLVPEPVAAAESHASRNFAGQTLGVYSLGSNGFATSVVRRARPAGFQLVGSLAGVEPLGGDDFDEALADHIRAGLGREFGAQYLADPGVRLALFGLRDECARAKQRLTVTTETDVLLRLPHGPTRVLLARAEFEELIRPALELTMDTLVRTVRSSGLQPDQLDGVLLVGGSSRIPLVAELVAARFPGPVTIEAEHQVTAATGAALAGCRLMSPPGGLWHEPDRTRSPSAVGDPDGPPPLVPQAAPAYYEDEYREPPPRPPVRITPLKLPRMRAASRLVPTRGSSAASRSS